MAELINSGCKISEIKDIRFKSINTPYAESIIERLKKADVTYSAKYNDEKLILAFSAEDEKKVAFFIQKAKSKSADLIERLRTEGGSTDDFLRLLPEVADVMDISVSSLQDRPAEIQLFLTQTYVDNWYGDTGSIRDELNKVTSLGYGARIESEEQNHKRESENNTPKEREEIHERDKQLDNAAQTEREINDQRHNAVTKEKKRTAFFTVEKLILERERISRSGHETETVTEMERVQK